MRYRSKFIPFAAVQVYVEHVAIVAQIDLKVALQAGVCLYHGYHHGKVMLYPHAQIGFVCCACDEALDGLSREVVRAEPSEAVRVIARALQHHALGP